MKKLIQKIVVLCTVCCLLLSAAALSASAATGSPVTQDDLESAGPGWTAVRSTDIAKNIKSVYENSLFGYPFPDGDKILKLASKSDPATAPYVINGNKSIYFTNDPAISGNELISPMMTLPADHSPAEFKGDKVYIARFLMRAIDKGSKLNIVVRTWDAADSWITFQFNPDVKKGYTIKPTGNLRLYDKAAIQKIGENDYEVALRFSGVNTSGADSYCYLLWEMNGRGGFAFDDMKIYESQDTPSKAFEIKAEGSDPTDPKDTGSTDSKDTGSTDSKKTGDNKSTSGKKTSSGKKTVTVSGEEVITDEDGSETDDEVITTEDGDTVVKEEVKNVTVQKDPVVFTKTSIAFIVAAAAVLLGSVVYIVVTSVTKKR